MHMYDITWEYKDGYGYHNNSTPAQLLVDEIHPQADIWIGDEYAGTLLQVAESLEFDNTEVYQCDGCKRYFYAGDTFIGVNGEHCYEHCSHLHGDE